MAQWMGQFTGRTHESKVKEIESTLSTAVDSLRSSNDAMYAQKAKAVFHLAERLLIARRKMLRARISRLTEQTLAKLDAKKVQSLIGREQKLNKDGVQGILAEFGASELVKVNSNKQIHP